MQILVDADATPVVIKDILFRAAERNRIMMVLVSNQKMKIPESEFISSMVVAAGPDEADDRIVEIAGAGDLIITADIPLADRVVSLGGFALNPRGEFYTADNIKQRLAMRDLMDNLRNSDIIADRQRPFTSRERSLFANELDRFISRHKRSITEG